MKGKTHLIFSASIAFFFSRAYGYPLISSILLITFGSLLPDIDCNKSLTGKKIWPISSFLGHRGLFHSLWPIFLMLPLSTISPLYAVIPLAIGYTSHLLLDALTPAGISPFWPLKFKIRGFIRTGSYGEHLILILSLFILVFEIVRLL